jgi:ribonuclease HI
MEELVYKIQTDGGSRGNPGPSAIGYVISGPDIDKKEVGKYIGETTNNVAEYSAVISALKDLKSILGEEKVKHAKVDVFADSELLVKQVKGQYRVKNPGLKELFLQLWNTKLDFKSVSFYHVRREQNKDADRMVNIALDQHSN